MNVMEEYAKWLAEAKDEVMQQELQAITGQEAEISDRFYRELSFGTAGLRGVLGAGTNRMNIYTVGKATQGLCEYLLTLKNAPSVAIAYDSRNMSTEFSVLAAEIFAGNGIHAYVYPKLMPTPCLSFAVRHLSCDGGVNITASHNPAKYNGYKVYGADGCQITEAAAEAIQKAICEVDCFKGVKKLPFEQGLANGLITYIGEDTVRAYLDVIDAESLLAPSVSRDIKIVYTPLNGAGISCVPQCLAEHGFTNITIPEEQRNPDGNFPTCPYPNPEIRQALEVAVACAEKVGAEFVLATDPDCDRVGTAVWKDGKFQLLTGNQIGALLLDFICRMKADNMPKNPVAVKTIVTTELTAAVAAHYGVELRNVLTGFKYIGEQIFRLEQAGEADRFLLGFEESYGYLTTPSVRDKDAVNASLLICEMYAWYKAAGRDLIDGLNEMYANFGYYTDKVFSFEFEGQAGAQTMKNLTASLRQNPLQELCGYTVASATDYLAEGTGLPKSDVLGYRLSNGTVVTVRPSGTEPKLKVYISACGASQEESAAVVATLEAWFRSYIAANS